MLGLARNGGWGEMKRNLVRLAIVGTIAICIQVGPTTTTVQAAKRVALVIGNDAYVNVPRLQKAANDARTIGQTLEVLGFEVIIATDVAT